MITSLNIGRYGRFANALWQIAGTIGIARKSGQNFAFPLFRNWDHLERFGSAEDIDCYKHFENELPRTPNIGFEHRYVHWGYHDVYLPVGNWDIGGHLQSPAYFLHCMDEVRHYMRMKGEVENDFVAVHWRAGDYQQGKNSYHPRLEMDYYSKAFEQFPKNTDFLIFSDDIEGAKKMFGQKDNIFYSEGTDYIQDFRLMKRCKGFICANSSYSVMAAVLSEAKDKTIVCPSLWFGPVAGINGSDIYPKGAIII